jgi:hypothetical protein
MRRIKRKKRRKEMAKMRSSKMKVKKLKASSDKIIELFRIPYKIMQVGHRELVEDLDPEQI